MSSELSVSMTRRERELTCIIERGRKKERCRMRKRKRIRERKRERERMREKETEE
jgi:hypothetical protein